MDEILGNLQTNTGSSEFLDSDKTITEQDVYPFAVKPSTRELTYQLLDEYNKTDLFPKEFYTIEKAAESNLVNWLVYPTELNAFPDELEHLQRVSIDSDEDDDAFHYEVFRYRINEPHWAAENGWMLGVVGILLQRKFTIRLSCCNF